MRIVGELKDANANTVLLNKSELKKRNYQHPEVVAVAVAVVMAIVVTDAVAVTAASY